MGMAASQARYLGLTARKTNCEWEGQQINQARTALANQSANLFNQMLALSVPDCPDKTDFTTLQYSYTDGNNESVIENWRQLSDSNKDYNYVVDHWYYADIYTGSKKLMSDPQVTIKNDSTQQLYNTTAGSVVFDPDGKSYTFSTTDEDGEPIELVYDDLTNYKFDPELQNAILDLAAQGYIETNEFGEVDIATLNSLRGYHDGTSWHFATVEDLENASNKELGLENGTWTLNNGYVDLSGFDLTTPQGLDDNQALAIGKILNDAGATGFDYEDATEVRNWLDTAAAGLGDKTSGYYRINGTTLEDATMAQVYTTPSINDMTTTFSPTYVGNAKLTELGALSEKDEAALAQIIKDCPDSSIAKYITLNPDGSIEYAGTGIYSFEWNGVQKFTTYDDLVDSMQTPLFNEKPIDAQQKLATYEASYIKTEVKETDKALIETDGEGRFKTIKFEDDSITYTLNCEQVSDEDAYNDAMNSYYHDVAEYEKKIADINAQTEIIQQQDRTLELRLKQLDTEQNALQTEMEAVKKVISKNVEMTFKTFSGS